MSVTSRHPAAADASRSEGFLSAVQDWALSVLFSGRLPAFLIAVAAGILIFGFLFTDDYQITGAVVDGAVLTDAREVAARAGVLGAPAFEVDAGEAARRVGALPAVERVETEVRFPGEMRIRIVEREPAMVWRAGGEQVLVDARGNVIARGAVPALPSVSGDADLAPGDQIPPEIVMAVSAIQTAADGAGSFRWDNADGLTLLSGGRRIIFGEPVEIPAKLAVLEGIESSVDDEWRELDLSEPTRPVYR